MERRIDAHIARTQLGQMMTAQTDYLVTGNKRHFPGSPYGITRVVNAAELLDRITMDI